MSNSELTDPLVLLRELRADVEAIPPATELRLRERLAQASLAQPASGNLSGMPSIGAEPKPRRRLPRSAVAVAIPASVLLGALGHAVWTQRSSAPPREPSRGNTAVSTARAVADPVVAPSRLPQEAPVVAASRLPQQAPAPPSVTARTKTRTTAPSVAEAPVRAPEPEGLESDLRLLERARTQLAEGHPASTLQLLRTHERTYPGSPLAQERDALTVKALVAAGSLQEAERRADAFVARYPRGLLLDSVERAVGKKP